VGLLMQAFVAGVDRVKRVLSRVRNRVHPRTRARDVETITAGDFRIDLENRTATLRGLPLQLTGEEFDLLVFLIDHPRKLVTQQTRLATNWFGHGLRETEFLRVLLSLRKKLDSEGSSQHYIRTEPWVLYRFDPGASQARVSPGNHAGSQPCSS
jgi:two-component system KDP operon response regulator KdpE